MLRKGGKYTDLLGLAAATVSTHGLKEILLPSLWNRGWWWRVHSRAVVQLLLPCYRDLPSILANKRLHQCINCNRLCYRGQGDSGHHSAVASFWLLNGKTWVNACVSLAAPVWRCLLAGSQSVLIQNKLLDLAGDDLGSPLVGLEKTVGLCDWDAC